MTAPLLLRVPNSSRSQPRAKALEVRAGPLERFQARAAWQRPCQRGDRRNNTRHPRQEAERRCSRARCASCSRRALRPGPQALQAFDLSPRCSRLQARARRLRCSSVLSAGLIVDSSSGNAGRRPEFRDAIERTGEGCTSRRLCTRLWRRGGVSRSCVPDKAAAGYRSRWMELASPRAGSVAAIAAPRSRHVSAVLRNQNDHLRVALCLPGGVRGNAQ